ncbi:hypothetical protein BST61_g7802 [Cercospora zeina]
MSAKVVAASNTSIHASFATLPPELLLAIIPQITYSPDSILSLLLTSRALHSLIKSHEYSLTRSIASRQIPVHQPENYFPSLDQLTTFANLSTYHTRIETLSNLVENYPASLSSAASNNKSQQCPSCSSTTTSFLLQPRWSTLHKTGLLLLYRLQDTRSYCHKVALLNGLPAISLACILFALLAQNRILRASGTLETLPRIEGKRWWESSSGGGGGGGGDVEGNEEANARRKRAVEMRETEMVCEELALAEGVGFYGDLWDGEEEDDGGDGDGNGKERKESWARRALQSELFSLPSLQTAFYPCCGAPRPPTLTSCLRRAFAAKCYCQFSEVERKVWEVLSNTVLDDVDEDLMGRIVRGEDAVGKGGTRRVF